MYRLSTTILACWLALLVFGASPSAAIEPRIDRLPALSEPQNSAAESSTTLFAAPPVAVTIDAAPTACDLAPAAGCGNQLWLISTRGIGGCRAVEGDPPLRVQRFQCGCGWQSSTLDEFLATDDPQAVTAFWIHGNDASNEGAINQGSKMYHGIAGQHCRRVRMVIWSWPADRVRGSLRNDAQIKYFRTNIEPFYIGYVLNRLRPDVPTVLIGYSFGARISTATLHLLGGGTINGRGLPAEPAAAHAPRRAVLLAAAVGRDSLIPGHRHGEALRQVDRMTITVNPRDRVLRFFPGLTADSEDALGHYGPAGMNRMGELRSRIVLMNVTPQVHKHHYSGFYENSPEIMGRIRQEVVTIGSIADVPAAEPAPPPLPPATTSAATTAPAESVARSK